MKAVHSCWYYLFCCCICKSCRKEEDPTKKRMYFKNWVHKGHEDLNIFEILIDAFAGFTNRLEELNNCRINPNYDDNTRNDLEFYIPQLCSYILDKDLSTIVGNSLNANTLRYFFSPLSHHSSMIRTCPDHHKAGIIG